MITLGAQCWLATATHLQGLRRCCPLPATDAKFLGPSGVGRSTALCGWPQFHAKLVEMSILAPEEIPKWLTSSLPDAGSGWTVTCHIPPHAFEMSTWSDFTSLCNFEVLLWHSHVPQHLHHIQSGFSGQCSHPCSDEGTARASLDQDQAQEDDFQTQHMPVCHVMWWEDDRRRSSAKGRLQHSRGSLGQWMGYQIDIGEEEEKLETVDPTWRATRWLQLVVQGLSDDEVPWYDLITPLMVGTEGVTLSLAKHLLAIWQWSIRIQGQDICPPVPMVLNIGQFMMLEEVQGMVDNSLWYEVYSHALQRVGEAVSSR